MTNILILGVMLLLLVLALEPAERRFRARAPRVQDPSSDRDWQRVQGDLQSRTPVPSDRHSRTPVRTRSRRIAVATHRRHAV